MTDTGQLIEQLAARAKPVRPLAPPLRRAALWLALAIAVVAAATAIWGLRPDLRAALATPAMAVEWIAALVTGLLAAYAVFQVSVPGRSPHWAWLPAPALIVWLSGLGWGCLGEWQRSGLQAFAYDGHGVECFGAITLISLPLVLILLIMVRHAGAVRPTATAALGVLSAAALAAAGVSLIHDGETALMVLLWHLGGVGLLTLMAGLASRRLFGWIGYAAFKSPR